jgi:hypothetical protein
MTTKDQAQKPSPEEIQELSLEEAAFVQGGFSNSHTGLRPPPTRFSTGNC